MLFSKKKRLEEYFPINEIPNKQICSKIKIDLEKRVHRLLFQIQRDTNNFFEPEPDDVYLMNFYNYIIKELNFPESREDLIKHLNLIYLNRHTKLMSYIYNLARKH